MTPADFVRWLDHTEIARDFAGSSVAYPLVLATHMSCIALFGGMIVMTNLRLLGLVMKDFPVAEVYSYLRAPKRVGFVIMVTCGMLLAASEASKYYPNPYFWVKMLLLALIGVHALVFRRSVYQKLAAFETAIPTNAKLAATLSLALWLGVAISGRLIGYFTLQYRLPR